MKQGRRALSHAWRRQKEPSPGPSESMPSWHDSQFCLPAFSPISDSSAKCAGGHRQSRLVGEESRHEIRRSRLEEDRSPMSKLGFIS
jgi:hypothetical protein